MKIKLLCNYRDDINEWYSKFLINDYHNLTFDKNNPDYYVLINHPFLNNKKQHYENDKTIYVYNEPSVTRKIWETWKKKETFLCDNLQPWSPWHLDFNINDLIKLKIQKNENYKKTITCLTTDLNMLEGHKLRLNFLKYLDILSQFNINSEIYGRKKTGIYDKLNLKNYKGDVNKRNDVLLPYYYHFMAENTSEVNYFTEKILDPILSETLCFYWGCPNIKNYLHEKSFIEIDLHKPKIAIETIIKSINNNEYEKRLKYIKETKKKILYELNPMTIIQNNIKEYN